jgi:hypothetical protein
MPDRFIDPPLLGSPFVLERIEEDDRKPVPRGGESSKRRGFSVSAVLAMLVAALVMVPAAVADDDDDGGGGADVVVFAGPVVQTCNLDNTPQQCDPRFLVPFSGEADRVTFDVSPLHCSSVRVELFVNGVSQGSSPFFGSFGAEPQSFTWNVDLDAGDVIELQATGTPGGCNAGTLFSWGGSVTIVDEAGDGDDDDDDDEGDDDDEDDDDDEGDDD